MASATILFILLAGLGIVLGQFFKLFTDNEDIILQRSYWWFLFSVLAFAFFIGLFVCARVMKQYAKPIRRVTTTALQLAEGDYLARTTLSIDTESNELAVAINKIAHNLQQMSSLRLMEKERLNTLIESMGSGLLMFGREGSVNLVNGVFEKTFSFKKESVLGKTFKSIELPLEIQNLIEDVFMTEQVHEKQVKLNANGQRSYVSVYGAPVIGIHGNWLGIVVVVHDITELVHLEKVRKDFVANVSHELRTPITSIKGFSETLLDGAMNEPEVLKDFLEIIQKESDRVHFLIDDLLELSGIETEEFSLYYKTVDLNDVIEDAIRIISGSLEQKKMNVVLNVQEEMFIEVDADRLIQVMVNLLSNAIKYSVEEKEVTISASIVGDTATIEVKDEGIGIKQAHLPRLFERFYRVDRARSRASGGTGLGLAIVKHLIEAHHGIIEVDSMYGEGTTFKIQLPIKKSNNNESL